MSDEPERRLTDQTESKVRQWALRNNGEPLTPKDVVELVLAVDDDDVERHHETMALVKPLQASFEEHCVEVDKRFLALEGQDLPRRSTDVIGSNHHAERSDFEGPLPTAIEHIARRVWVMWGVGIWLTMVASTALINLLIEKL